MTSSHNPFHSNWMLTSTRLDLIYARSAEIYAKHKNLTKKKAIIRYSDTLSTITCRYVSTSTSTRLARPGLAHAMYGRPPLIDAVKRHASDLNAFWNRMDYFTNKPLLAWN